MKAKTQTAVISIDGKQVPVIEGQYLSVDYRNVQVGSVLQFNDVLAIFDDSTNSIGAPYISNASVEAEVLGQAKGEKVIVFKKKRRKGYKVKNGFRKKYTQVLIKKITNKN